MRNKTKVVRYSDAFKQQVLSEIQEGGLTIAQAQRKYEINGAETIKNWAKKFGNFEILPKVIRVEDPKEQDRLKALEAENQRLKDALADTILERKIAESTLETICQQKGWDIDEIKKKAGMRSPTKPSKKGKK